MQKKNPWSGSGEKLRTNGLTHNKQTEKGGYFIGPSLLGPKNTKKYTKLTGEVMEHHKNISIAIKTNYLTLVFTKNLETAFACTKFPGIRRFSEISHPCKLVTCNLENLFPKYLTSYKKH